MFDKDAAFDPMWVPPRYPQLNAADRGVWRPVQDQNGESVGLVWSNLDNASGVIWINQTPAITTLYKYFSLSAEGKIPAGIAYHNADSQPGVKLGQEKTGSLSGALHDLQAIEDDIDEASS